MLNIYDIWLSLCENVGPVRAKLLVDYYGSSEMLYKSKPDELSNIGGLSKTAISDLYRKSLKRAEEIMEACKNSGCSALGISDPSYPMRLRNIYDPPIVLYIKGALPDIDSLPVIGIVGTRHCTPYGYRNAEILGRELSDAGISVATGLAKGIDTAAATGGAAGRSPVIGVIGCGIDIIYPVTNRQLFKKVLDKGGAIVSEYPPGTPALPAHFPTRNRIISGLSNGIAVIEAPARSGALITAQFAVEQCRDVFALPANVDMLSCAGSNRLLREGAIPFITSADIIDEYKDLYHIKQKPIDNKAQVDYIDVSKTDALDNLIGVPKAIAKAILNKPLYVDEIISSTGINAQVALASLTSLELSGLAGRNNLGKWEIKSKGM